MSRNAYNVCLLNIARGDRGGLVAEKKCGLHKKRIEGIELDFTFISGIINNCSTYFVCIHNVLDRL